MDSTSRANRNEAAAEGRRIYLGNLLYTVTPSEIEEALEAYGFNDYENIHISVDPESGRNPGYCFVDFHDADTANRALTSLSATIRGRTLKVGPCEPRKQQQRSGGYRTGERDEGERRERNFDRWGGGWGQSAETGERTGSAGRGPRGASDHYNSTGTRETENSKKLYVGGLGNVTDQEQNQAEVRELFDGFNPTAIGKRITAHESTRSKPGNHNYCFVDFETAEEASAAMNAVDGKYLDDTRVRVSLAKGSSGGSRPQVRQSEDGENPRASYSDSRGENSGRSGGRAFASNDWRRKEG